MNSQLKQVKFKCLKTMVKLPGLVLVLWQVLIIVLPSQSQGLLYKHRRQTFN